MPAVLTSNATPSTTDFIATTSALPAVPTPVEGIEFADRRAGGDDAPGVERRQFAASRTSANPAVNELAEAIDQYKLANRRRFITIEELHGVITELGYRR